MNETKQCVIFDVDGTLTDTGHRLHHIQKRPPDWPAFFDACVDDPPHDYVVELNHVVAQASRWRYDEGRVAPVVFLCSGRPETHRAQTEAWMAAHGVFYKELLMRAEGDYRADTVVKREMLDAIRGRGYEVLFAVDDRPSVVRMWRENDVPVLQVDDSSWHGRDGAEHQDAEGKTLLTLMVGPSGAGKTTWLKNYGGSSPTVHDLGIFPAHVVSSDQVREDLCGDWRDQSRNREVFSAIHAVAGARLRHGLPVVIDATHLRRRDRRAAAELAPAGSRVRYVVCDRPLAAKLADARTPEDVVRRHDQTFRSQLKDILAGDETKNVDVVDLRQT